MPVTIETRMDLTLEAAKRVGWGGEAVIVSAPALKRMGEARAAFERLIEAPNIGRAAPWAIQFSRIEEGETLLALTQMAPS